MTIPVTTETSTPVPARDFISRGHYVFHVAYRDNFTLTSIYRKLQFNFSYPTRQSPFHNCTDTIISYTLSTTIFSAVLIIFCKKSVAVNNQFQTK